MVYRFPTFETATTGQMPPGFEYSFDAGANDEGEPNSEAFVTENDPLAGDKSFLLSNQNLYTEVRTNEYNGGDVEGAFYWNLPDPFDGEGMEFHLDDGEWCISIGRRSETSTDLLEVWFADEPAILETEHSETGRDFADMASVGTLTGTIPVGDEATKNIGVRGVNTNLKIFIDNVELYESGQAFSGGNTLFVHLDDGTLLIDAPAIPSDLVYEEGKQVFLAEDGNPNVNEGEENLPLQTRGNSEFVFINGSPAGRGSGEI